MKIGIPRGFTYYLDDNLSLFYLKELNIDVVVSPKTNNEIINKGRLVAPDEMCLSAKNYLGHISYLSDKCDYILVNRFDNFNTFNQTCTNFLAIYDLACNLFDSRIIGLNIDCNNNQTFKSELVNLGIKFGKSKNYCLNAYTKALEIKNRKRKQAINKNLSVLNSKRKKVLLVSHAYNTYDEMIGKPIVDYFSKMDIDIVYSDLFDKKLCRKLSYKISPDLYWKYSKESIGALEIAKNRIDGVLFISTFPCGLDSLVNELVMLKTNLPFLNIVIDDLDAHNGLETRIESFCDIIKN